MAKILLVEDEVAHQLIIKKALDAEWAVELSGSYEDAKRRLSKGSYDLFLLDIMLGDGLGYDLIDEIKGKSEHQSKPIIFLTSNENVEMKVKCFSLGADDYVVKPCDPRELRARIQAKLNKPDSTEVATDYKNTGFIFKLGEQQAFFEHQGHPVPLDLTPIEYRLLFVLVRQGDHPLSRDSILKMVWGESHHVQARSVDTYVAALRKKIKEYDLSIKSVHGVGYKIQIPEPLKAAS